MDLLIQLIINGLIIGITYAIIALGLTLIFGILGIINFAHGEFYMLGAFGSFVLQESLGLNYFLSGLLSIGIIALLAWLIERYTLSPLIGADHLNSLLATFGLSVIIVNAFQMYYGTNPRQISTPFDGVVQFGKIFITQQKIFVVVVGIAFLVGIYAFIKYSKMGKLMRAVSQNSMGAMVSGIPIKRIYRFSFVLGVSIACLAGFLIGPTTYVTPTMGMSAMLKGFIIVILGGLGSVPGAILGGLLLGFIETSGSFIIGNDWKDLIGFLMLIIVLIIRPQGIFGLRRRSQ